MGKRKASLITSVKIRYTACSVANRRFAVQLEREWHSSKTALLRETGRDSVVPMCQDNLPGL